MLESLKKIYEKALKDKEGLLAKIEPLRKKEAAAVAKKHKAEAELLDIRKQIVSVETNGGLEDLSRAIAQLAPKAKRLQ